MPVKAVALEKASAHLQVAGGAARAMAAAADFAEYEMAWTNFLSEAGRFYSKIEQGAKGCDESEYWWGLKKHERRHDPLLRYIQHARNTEEHTLDYSTSVAVDEVGVYGDGKVNLKMKMMVDENRQMHVRNLSAFDDRGQALPIQLVNERPSLVTVKARDGLRFRPPKIHLTRPIVDQSPLGVANLALTYLTAMLGEAQKLPVRM